MRVPVPRSHSVRRLLGLVAAGALVGAAITHSGSAVASTPAEGTVSDSSTSVSWTGGPFAVPNVTGTALDAPDCTAPQCCDDFTLHVSTPGRLRRHPLSCKIEVSWPQRRRRLRRLRARRRPATRSATAASSADPEQVVLPPTTGDLHRPGRARSLPLGQSYTATATLVDQARPTAAPAPRRRPASPTTPRPKACTDAQQRRRAVDRQQLQDRRDDVPVLPVDLQGHLRRHAPARRPRTGPTSRPTPPTAARRAAPTSLDPILFTDHATGRTFESQLTGADSLHLLHRRRRRDLEPQHRRRHPVAASTTRPSAAAPTSADGLGALPTVDLPERRLLLQPGHRRPRSARRRRDGGTTFGAGVPTYSLLDCGGLHGHVKVAPGRHGVPAEQGLRRQPGRRRSRTDNGTDLDGRTRSPAARPATPTRRSASAPTAPSTSATSAPTARPGVAVSHDQGKTWITTSRRRRRASASRTPSSRPMVAGDDDRAAFAFLGTTDRRQLPGRRQLPRRLAPLRRHHLRRRQDLGDQRRHAERPGAARLDLHRRHHLRQRPQPARLHRRHRRQATAGSRSAFADGCIDACVTDPPHQRRRSGRRPGGYATIARQSSGLGLFAAYDPQALKHKLHKPHGGQG